MNAAEAPKSAELEESFGLCIPRGRCRDSAVPFGQEGGSGLDFRGFKNNPVLKVKNFSAHQILHFCRVPINSISGFLITAY